MVSVSKNSGIITPCQLVYIDPNKSVEVKSELDFDKLWHLWGIECGGAYIALCNEAHGNWQKAISTAENLTKRELEGELLNKWQFQLPSVNELGDCFFEKRKFAETIAMIQNTSFEADDWQEGWYWSKDEFGCNRAHTFDMNDGIYATHNRMDNNGFVRLALVSCE